MTAAPTSYSIVTVADRPDLADALFSFSDGWPPFMLHDPIGRLMDELAQAHPHLQLLLLDADDNTIAKAMCTPIEWTAEQPWEELPDRGWDWALESGYWLTLRDGATDVYSALEVSVRPHLRGTGLSAVMLAAMREAVIADGGRDLVAPVRPSAKSEVAREPIESYAFRTRDDGLPVDPWMRVHARAGATVVKVAPLSMTIPGTLDEWREWTGLPFDHSGSFDVPGALTPVHADFDQNHAVYVEPNVWMHHPLT